MRKILIVAAIALISYTILDVVSMTVTGYDLLYMTQNITLTAN